ncbi:MAG: Kelch repeat-containing protein [Solirubrobacteraceae bacterium]
MTRPTTATYARRRAVAVLGLVGAVAVVLWLVLSGGSSSRPTHTVAHTTHTTARAKVSRRRSAPAGLPLTGIAPGRWAALPESPTSRGEVSAARIGDVVYVVGGFDAAGRTSDVVQRVDLRTQRWSEVAAMPQALNHMSAVSYGGKLYVVGGYSSAGDSSTGAVRGFWRYDPATGRWSSMPDAPVARAAAGAAVLGHRLYVAGGRNDITSALSSLAIFDFESGRWTLGPSLAHPREHLAAVAAEGAIWALGGRALGLGSFTYVERYAPGSSAWQPVTPLPVARSGFQAVDAGGSIVVVGGEDGTQTVGEVDRLDLRTGRWSRLADLPVARHGLGVVADGPLVFAIDGGPQAGLTMSRLVSRLRVR